MKGFAFMSFAQELGNLKIKHASCAVGRVLETLNNEDAHALMEVLKDRSIPSSKIAHVLEKYGYKMSNRTVDRHRNIGTDKNRCSCEH